MRPSQCLALACAPQQHTAVRSGSRRTKYPPMVAETFDSSRLVRSLHKRAGLDKQALALPKCAHLDGAQSQQPPLRCKSQPPTL